MLSLVYIVGDQHESCRIDAKAGAPRSFAHHILGLCGFAMDMKRQFDRDRLIEYMHLFGLCGFSIAQPLYDLLGQNATFFVAHSANPLAILSLVFVVSFGVPLVLMVVEVIARLFGENLRRGIHWFFVGSLFALAVLPPVGRLLNWPGYLVLLIAAVIGATSTVLYVRSRSVWTFVTVLAYAALIFPLYFLVITPVNRLVLPDMTALNEKVEIGNTVPVVLVVFDEFGAAALLDENGHVDPVRFPNFASLATHSWWFPNAVALHSHTHVSIPTILTGQQPSPNAPRTPTALDYPSNLFVLLGEQYRLNVLEGVTKLCPTRLCGSKNSAANSSKFFGILADVVFIAAHMFTPPSLREQLPSFGARWKGFGLDAMRKEETDSGTASRSWRQRTAQLDAFLSGINGGSRNQLNFLHIELPHVAYQYLASGRSYTNDSDWSLEGISDLGQKQPWSNNTLFVQVAYQRYLHQIGYVDRFLGRLVRRLKDVGLYEDSLIVVTADHGVSFRPGYHRRHIDEGNFVDILKVPMFVKLPKQQAGFVSNRLVTSVDVVPTIVDVLDIKSRRHVDGHSMLHDSPPRAHVEVIEHRRFAADELVGFSRLEWQKELFGSRTRLDGLVLKGPYSNLIGKKVSSVRVGSSERTVRAVVGRLKFFDDVDLSGSFLPALLRGTIESTEEMHLPLDLAIALNGRIWATTTTSEWAGSPAYFVTMLPEVAFKNGRNRVDVFRITRMKNVVQLRPIVFEHAGDIILGLDASGQQKLVFPDGRNLYVSVDNGELRGNVEEILLDRNNLVFGGWAADVASNQPAQSVLVFAGSQLVADARPRMARQDVASALNLPSVLHSGFAAMAPAYSIKTTADNIRAFVVSSRGVARELGFNEGIKKELRALLPRIEITYRSDRSGKEFIVFPDGRAIPVKTGGDEVRGNLDDVLIEDEKVKVIGWAADVVLSKPVQSVFFVADGYLLAEASPRYARQDVANAVGKASVLYSGFSVDIPADLRELRQDDIRVFAVSARQEGIELKFQGDAKARLAAALGLRSDP